MSWELSLILVSALISLISVLATYFAFMQSRKYKIYLREEDLPEKRKGLILLVGPSVGSALYSIEYHIETLQICWLVGSTESKNTIKKIRETYPQIRFLATDEHFINPDNINSTFNAVSKILGTEIQIYKLGKNEVIADITGGLKPMAAGMAIACVSHNCNMQYIKTARDSSGKFIQDSLPQPVKVDTSLK